jgi:hypothetical protein
MARIRTLSQTRPVLVLMNITALMMALFLLSPQPVLAQGRLFMASDVEEFSIIQGNVLPFDRLAVVRTIGAVPDLPPVIINTPYPVNGLGEGAGFLWAGQPFTVGESPGNTLRVISSTEPSTGRLLFPPIPSSDAFPTDCCNEEMAEFPAGVFYHAHFSDVIQRLAFIPSDGEQRPVSIVQATFPQADVVGMTVVTGLSSGPQIWITKWNAQQVGIWDPATNTFTSVFSTTPRNAGALAWDPTANVLWVGLQGGEVVPYNTTGTQLGPSFKPFGDILATIDGLAFIPDP